jgi:hypothetical protein
LSLSKRFSNQYVESIFHSFHGCYTSQSLHPDIKLHWPCVPSWGWCISQSSWLSIALLQC